MTDIAADERIRRDYHGARRRRGRRRVGPDPEPGDARRQHLQRLAGRRHRAGAARLRRDGRRAPARPATGRIPIDDFFVRSGVTTLAPRRARRRRSSCRVPTVPRGSVHVRRTRRRGHDLASVTLACSVEADGVTRIAYGSVGPRPVLVVDETGVLADAGAPPTRRARALDELFADARAVADLDAARAPSTGSRCCACSGCARSRRAHRAPRRRRGDDAASSLTRQRPRAVDRRRAAPHAARGPPRRPRR